MCLIAWSPKPMTCLEDKKVYKIVYKNRFGFYYTPVQNVLLQEYPKDNDLEKAIYAIKKRAVYHNNEIFACGILSEGIHCYNNKSMAEYFNERSQGIIIEGIIPKGTKYWISTDNIEIASTYIRFKVCKLQRLVMTITHLLSQIF